MNQTTMIHNLYLAMIHNLYLAIRRAWRRRKARKLDTRNRWRNFAGI